MLKRGIDGIPLGEIGADIRTVEADIFRLLAQVIGSGLEDSNGFEFEEKRRNA